MFNLNIICFKLLANIMADIGQIHQLNKQPHLCYHNI